MTRGHKKRVAIGVVGAFVLAVGLAVVARLHVLAVASAFEVEEPRDAVPTDAAIVLGGAPRFVRDRVVTAAELYRRGKVKKVLITGDADIDDVALMRRIALAAGVPESALLVDTGAARTISSCLRARTEFQLRHAIVVTQRFHLPRAVYLCRSVGPVDTVGVVADRGLYGHARLLKLRETPASVRAVLDVIWWRLRSH